MPGPWDKGLWDPLQTFAFETITVATVGIGVTAATAQSAKRGVFVIETSQVRYRADGTAPTATVGVIADPGAEITVYGNDVMAIQFIRTTGTSASVQVHYAR